MDIAFTEEEMNDPSLISEAETSMSAPDADLYATMRAIATLCRRQCISDHIQAKVNMIAARLAREVDERSVRFDQIQLAVHLAFLCYARDVSNEMLYAAKAHVLSERRSVPDELAESTSNRGDDI